jgi:hypothetical protein
LLGFDFFGEAGYGFFSGLDGAGEHEADGVEELHAGVVEAAGGGEGDDFGEGAEEHAGASDGLENLLPGDGRSHLIGWDRVRFGDGFFDERLLDAGAHVAGDEFDEVPGLVGRGAARRSRRRRSLGAGPRASAMEARADSTSARVMVAVVGAWP